MSTIKKTIFLPLLFIVSTASAQTTHYINVGNNGFSEDSLLVEMNDIVQFSLDLSNNSGPHYSTTTSVPGGGTTWNFTFTCMSCVYDVIINQPGTYLHIDANSGATGVIYTDMTSDIKEVKKTQKKTDNRIFDLLGKEYKDVNSIPFGTFYIQNGMKYIKKK